MAKKKKSSRKEVKWAIIVLLIFSFVVYIFPEGQKVCFKDTCFRVEIVESERDRSIGLMYREKIDASKGMLFIFPEEGKHPFWMRNTLIPLDIIWLDKDYKAVYIQENAQPCKESVCGTLKPDQDAMYVLEINAGKVKEMGLKVDDEMFFE